MKKKIAIRGSVKETKRMYYFTHACTHIIIYIYRRYLYTIKHIINYVYNRARIGFAAMLRKRRRSVVLFCFLLLLRLSAIVIVVLVRLDDWPADEEGL